MDTKGFARAGRWMVLVGVLAFGIGLAQGSENVMRFSTYVGWQAVATFDQKSAKVFVAEHRYSIMVRLDDLEQTLSRRTFIEAVDTVLNWADRERVAEGFANCVLEVRLRLTPNGVLSAVEAKDCMGRPVGLYLL